jgi:hypothetical protein
MKMENPMIYKILAIAMFCLTFNAACSHFDRSSDSGYNQGGNYQPGTTRDHNYDRDMRKTAYELGLDPSQKLSSDEQALVNDRIQVRSLERTLGSKKEREQYSKILPWLKTDREKIEFLSIPSLEGRQQWANTHGIWDRTRVPVAEMKELIDAQDIAVGMPQDYVKRAWGEPQNVDISGNPIYKNERWRYQRFISSPDGYKKETRLVYFEGGRVVGWETE